MPNPNQKSPLGLLLHNAGLISYEKLQSALNTQQQHSNMKLGEVLILQAGVRAKTIDFFVNKWQKTVSQGRHLPIGYYLKDAGLLSENQIKTILQEQQSNQQKFGILAVKRGWIEQETIDFFVESLSLKPPQLISLSTLQEYNSDTLCLKKKYANYSLILSRILAWTGGNLHLTKTICHIFANSDLNIPTGSEFSAVDLFIESSLIKKWQVSEAAEYIRVIGQNLVNNPRYSSKLLLKEYREILLSGSKEYQNTEEQNELLLLGLLSHQNKQLSVANIIYQQVFNQDFLAQQLSKTQPDIATANNSKNKNEIVPNTKHAPIEVNHKTKGEKTKVTQLPNSKSKKGDSNSNHAPIEVNHKTKGKKTNDSKPKIGTPKPLTIIVSLIALGTIALLAPLFLKMNNYYSLQLQQKQQKQQQEQAESDFTSEVKKFEQFCNGIDFTDSSASLSLISQLEENQQQLGEIPQNCRIALNRLRIMAAPELGKESRILEAIKHLCKIPGDSQMHLEAEVWLKHWYDSPTWGQKTKLYLEDFAEYKDFDCPAAHFVQSKN
ncbi:MAG: hypothetical protein AAF383_10455 [Cyanobacteria bacterium P01_A01_bin.83]